MSKFIWEYNKTYQGQPFKNKFTVVYENKTYYYYKVNGSDRLQFISKSVVDTQDGTYFSTNYDISEDEEQYQIKLREYQLVQLDRSINMYNRDIKLKSEMIEDSKRKIETYEKRKIELKKELDTIKQNKTK